MKPVRQDDAHSHETMNQWNFPRKNRCFWEGQDEDDGGGDTHRENQPQESKNATRVLVLYLEEKRTHDHTSIFRSRKTKRQRVNYRYAHVMICGCACEACENDSRHAYVVLPRQWFFDLPLPHALRRFYPSLNRSRPPPLTRANILQKPI